MASVGSASDFVPAGGGQPPGQRLVVQQAGHGTGHPRLSGRRPQPGPPVVDHQRGTPLIGDDHGNPGRHGLEDGQRLVVGGTGMHEDVEGGEEADRIEAEPGEPEVHPLGQRAQPILFGPLPEDDRDGSGVRAASTISSGRFQSTSRIEPPITLAPAPIPSCFRASSRVRSAGSAMPFATIS